MQPTSCASLFSPGRIGSLYIKNRIVMAPLGSRLTSENGAVTEDMIEFYSQRASGGTGLIVIEAMGIDYPLAVGKPNHVRFHEDRYMPGHAKLVERIHECGAKTFALLWHAGINRGMYENTLPVGPSAIYNPFTCLTPHELTQDEIHVIVEKFGQAAARAMACGYDGVNVHAAHGYLISSFVSAATNQRTDAYGGSLGNRLRFPLEILRAIRRHTAKDYPVVFRINGDDFIDGGITMAEAAEFARALEADGIDAIDVSAGVYGSIDTMIEPIQYNEGWKLYLSEHIRKNVNVPVFGVGVILDPGKANQAIADGQTDFVAIGRELLAEPQWANKAAAGDKHFPKCIGCNACFARIGLNLPIRCAINPLAGRELHAPQATRNPRKIAVVGAGPAGITAAIVAANRGHDVTLFESRAEIGGQLLIAGKPPHKEKINTYIRFLNEDLRRSNVKALCSRTFLPGDAGAFDHVIVATGANARDLALPVTGAEKMTAWDALACEAGRFNGRHVVVIGAGSVGCETALYCSEGGAQSVTVVEVRDTIAVDVDFISRMKLIREIKEAEIRLCPCCTMEQVNDGKATLQSGDCQEFLPCDVVIIAVGAVKQNEIAETLYENQVYPCCIGDAQTIGKIGNAVRSGFDATATI